MAQGAASGRRRSLGQDNAAASSVIATSIMISVVVILAATALWMALGFADSPPDADQYSGFVVEPKSQGQALDMQLLAGSSVPIQKSTLIVTVDGARAEYPLVTLDGLSTELTWPVGHTQCIVGPGSACIVATASVVELALVVDGLTVFRDRHVLSPLLLTGSGIQASCAGPVSYRIIHVAGTYGPFGPAMAVNMSLSNDGGSNWEDPWSRPVVTGDAHTEPLVGAGSLLALEGHGTATGLDATYASHPADPHVYVGVDGSPVPSVLAFGGAAGVEDVVEPYVDFIGGTFTLQANEAIMLWEFDPAIVSATSDYQDTVVLLTLPPATC